MSMGEFEKAARDFEEAGPVGPSRLDTYMNLMEVDAASRPVRQSQGRSGERVRAETRCAGIPSAPSWIALMQDDGAAADKADPMVRRQRRRVP